MGGQQGACLGPLEGLGLHREVCRGGVGGALLFPNLSATKVTAALGLGPRL
jgi:hypothetical protein